MNAGMTSVRVRGLMAGYDRVTVLRDLDLDVPGGSLTAVLGASGSGKTTLLRVLAGFLRPSAGAVWFGDREIASATSVVPPERRRVGIVPQEGALFPHLDVRANVAFGLPRGPQSRGRVEEVLALVGLSDLAAARPQELSGGQQQRVALARALAPRPEVVLLDEPFSALDAGLRVRLRTEVREVLREVGTTAILVTHDQEEALSMSDLVAVLRDGRLIQVGTPREVYESPTDLGIAEFIGDVVELPVLAEVSPTMVRCALGIVEVEEAVGMGWGRDTVVLRPEQVVLTVSVDDKPDDGDTGVVRGAQYHGHDTMLTVSVSDGIDIPVRVSSGTPPRVGDRVRVAVSGRGRRYR